MSSRKPVREEQQKLKVLVLSRNYPNCVLDVLGLWVQRLVQHSVSYCEPKVVAPVPYCPPLPGLPEYYARFRRIPRRCWAGGVEVFHPRLLLGPGYALHAIEASLYALAARPQVSRLRRRFPFDLIHAHYTYPDGVVAVRLGRRYRVPVIITEQNLWGPWMDAHPSVRRKAVWAARESTFQIAISSAVRESIACDAGESEKLRVIPDGVDGSAFTLPEDGRRPVSNQILFVGAIRPVKGADVLLQAMRMLLGRGRDLKLVFAGESYFRSYQREHDRIREMVRASGLEDHIQFLGKQLPNELVRAMQESALLALPSRAESLGMVLLEALACGTPVVATRCGGPEDIVNDQVGILVPPEDPEALARGIEAVLDRRARYDPKKLRAYALDNFGLETVGRRIADLYAEALERFHWRASRAAEPSPRAVPFEPCLDAEEEAASEENLSARPKNKEISPRGAAGMTTGSV
jgi:glycosyltransferase involved in cell wall biosynthesis